MFRKSISATLQIGAVAFLLFALLVAGYLSRTPTGFWGSAVREIEVVCRDPATQLMAVLSLAFYFGAFIYLKENRGGVATARRWRWGNANLWLAGWICLLLASYAFTPFTETRVTQLPVLLGSILFGEFLAAGVRLRSAEREQRTAAVVGVVIGVLAVLALWRPEAGMRFQYHGAARWSGVWVSPNWYGLLMGTGMVLSLGLLLWAWPRHKHWSAALPAALGICGLGWFNSYSRGAWLGTLCGVVYIAFAVRRSPRIAAWLRGKGLSLAILAMSLLLLEFWQFRFSGARPVERAFSTVNANDFSWRNRVAAWAGAVHMMADRPLKGFGWGQAEAVYRKRYSRTAESAAIETNDYFMVGISAGVPALICLAVYLALVYRSKPVGGGTEPSIFVVCRAGSIVPLVGFWFDGGMFELAVGSVFWTLLELSSCGAMGQETDERAVADRPERGVPSVRAGSWHTIWLRWLAWVLAAVAGVETLVYAGTPFLSVGGRTLAVARHGLVSPKERADFETLAARPIWQDQKLKTLLDHVELAVYNRELINWKLDQTNYEDYVLSPVITGKPGEQLNWRRPLWEEFYPRIRHENFPADAAQIVVRHLRERVTVVVGPNLPHEVPDIWLRQLTDQIGFEIIYVAALRSVGVPARLDAAGQAELFADGKWQAAPEPAVMTW
jgi:hypothetical protein